MPDHYYYTLRIRDGRKTWTSKNIYISNDLGEPLKIDF